MQDVLSQQEIDALLSSLSTGDVSAEEIKQEQEEKRIRLYDFRRPNRFSTEQMRTLEMMHENFARLLTTFFSAHLRTAADINLLSVQELTYDEFIRSVLNPTVMLVGRTRELDSDMIMEMNPVLAFTVIERMLGGPGVATGEARSLTDIEQMIIRRLAGQVFRNLDDAWSHVTVLQPSIERVETNPQFVQIVAGNEMVALVSFEVQLNEAQGILNLCYPYVFLKPVVHKLSARHWFSRSQREEMPPEGTELLRQRLARARVPLTVEIGKSEINTRDLLSLQEGDVIPLEAKVREALDVRVGTRAKFKARPGVVGTHLAVEITEICVEEDEDW